MKQTQPTQRNMPMLLLLVGLLLLSHTGCKATATTGEPVIQTIAFASCAKADQPQEIWQNILANDPDLFLFIGDNVYVDIPKPPTGVEDFERTYAEFEENQPGYRALRERVPVLATWDDHDFGLNDAGKEFPLKAIAQQQFAEFFDLPDDSPVRQRPGVYDAHLFGPEGKRVQVILLDTRMFRDPLKRNPAGRPSGLGPYVPHTENAGTLLGEAQWAWLAKQLKQPADLRIIASSIQVIPDEHGWECWGNFPHERERLFGLIASSNANGVVFISGDRHHTEVSMDDSQATPYPIWDFTSSGMKERDRPKAEPNRNRRGPIRKASNFGLLTIDWQAAKPRVVYESRGADNGVLIRQELLLKHLRVDARR